MWALIFEGRVTETTGIDPSGRFHPSLEWVKCANTVQAGMVYAGGKFSEYIESAPVYTHGQIEALRLGAYADPFAGSDRHFAEAIRLQAMGVDSVQIEAANASGAHRFAEIQSEYPWSEA